MSANVTNLTPDTYTGTDVSERRTLHDASAQEAIAEAFTYDNVVKSGRAFGRSKARKVLRANFEGMTAEDIVAHCLELS